MLCLRTSSEQISCDFLVVDRLQIGKWHRKRANVAHPNLRIKISSAWIGLSQSEIITNFKIYFYYLLLFVTDMNECGYSIHNCDINAQCSNSLGSFSCACNEGYTGRGTMCSGNWKKSLRSLFGVFVILLCSHFTFHFLQVQVCD